jgi:hypothetical protein
MSCGCGCGGSAQAKNTRRGFANYSNGSFGFVDAASAAQSAEVFESAPAGPPQMPAPLPLPRSAATATQQRQPTQALGKLPAPPSGMGLVGPPAMTGRTSCPQAHRDADNVARQIARLKAALTRSPPDPRLIAHARKALQMAVTGILQSGHYARTRCGKQDLLRLQRFLARIGAGLPQADRVVLNRISNAARVFAAPG